jgi:putative endonuclease
MYYVYLLKSQVSDKVYLGYTNYLKRRVKEHSNDMNKTTKKILPIKLVYYEAYESKTMHCVEKKDWNNTALLMDIWRKGLNGLSKKGEKV